MKRRSLYILAGVAAALTVASAVVFNPAFQRSQLLKRAGPMVQSLEIGRLHVTPWSTEFDDLTVNYAGGVFHVDSGRARYGLGSLIVSKINVRQLSLQGVSADLSNFEPPQGAVEPVADGEPAGPFAGVLASLDAGFSYILDEISVEADVRLPAGQSIAAALSGGGIRPDTAGELNLEVRLATGNGEDHVDIDGTVRVDQLSRGKFAGIDTQLGVIAELASLPETERLGLRLRVSPDPGVPESPGEDADGRPLVTPEAIDVSLRQTDSSDETRAALSLVARYDGNSGDFTGDYELTANEQLVQPYAADARLAPARQSLSGDLAFNLANVTGEMTVNGELLVSDLQATYANEQLPQRLQLKNNFRVTLLPNQQLRIDRLQATVGDEGERRALDANVQGNQSIPLDDLAAYLRQDNTLLSFELPDIPLTWLNVFLPDHQISQGTLTGGFQVSTDAAGAIHLRPEQPLTVSGLAVRQGDEALFENLSIVLSPSVSYTGDSVSVDLSTLQVRINDDLLATGDLRLATPLSEAQGARMTASVQAKVFSQRLAQLLEATATGASSLPDTLDLNLQAALHQRDTGMTVDTLDAAVLTSDGLQLVKATLTQPLEVEQTASGSRLVTPAGGLATINVSDIDLGWFSAFLADASLSGILQRADFAIAVDDAGTVSIAPEQAFRVNGVTLATSEGTLLDDIGISVSPRVSISSEAVDIRYADLKLTGGDAALASGGGTLRSATGAVAAEGTIDVDLQGLARQPLVARALGAELSAPLRMAADYTLTQQGDSVDVSRLSANLLYGDGQPRLTVVADEPVRVRTRLATDGAPADAARGEVTLTIQELTAAPFADILGQHGVSFQAANGKAVLSSDGNSMRVNTDGPLSVSGITLRDDSGALLEPFAVTLDASANVAGDRLNGALRQLKLAFAKDSATPAVEANAEFALDAAGDAVWLSSLTGNVAVALPAVLRQPSVMPDNKLTAGALSAQLALTQGGRVDSTLTIDGLKAGKKALPLQSIRSTITGSLNRDGGFSLTAPVTMTGQSGTSDLQVIAQQGDGALSLASSGDVLYLNDVLSTLEAISGQQAAPAATADNAPTAEPVKRAASEPDTQPFWTAKGEGVQVEVDVKKLYYTDYFAIDGLVAHARMLPRQLALEDLRASFHDSPLALDGTLDFASGPAPYDLKLHGSVNQLDLATFFRELVPGSRPRAEGLFDFNVDAFGQSPNMPQYRNELFFGMTAQSRNGLFRLLDPDSALVGGSSEIAGGFGEVVSHIPTGLFGLGAVSRLVAYIKTIEYDKVQVELVRSESRDVQIRQFALQSPEVLLTASGGVDYQQGVDILQSPLELDAQLNMRGEGAAIMYNMDLLESERDAWNYWKGPTLRFWGTPAVTQSNLSDVISQAGKGMVLGGLSRPVSGLVGNARHRWTSDKMPALDYDATATDDTQ